MIETFNPWHHVKPTTGIENQVNGIIEIPKGTRCKYELDKESGLLILDRILFSSVYYPANYGFIPQTYCDDKDPLDILVISLMEFVPLCIVPSKVIGVMHMVDNDEGDDKIIAVAAGDPNLSHINDISELPAHFITEIRNFFENYTKLEKKQVQVKEFYGKERAMEILNESYELYEETYGSKIN